MSYNPNIPTTSQYMLQSQPQIRANYQAINSAFSQNHKPLNDDLQGSHTVLTFREQSGDPTTTATQTALYTKSVSSNPCLFYRPNNNQTPIQLTYPTISTGLQSTNPDVYIAQQYSYLAAPFVFYLGTFVGVTSGQAIAMTPITTILYIGLTIKEIIGSDKNSFATACATNIVGNTFNIQFDAALPAQNVSYQIIGF